MEEHKLKKGYDIKLAGESQKIVQASKKPSKFAMQPVDFIGIKPRLEVDIGTKVKAGTSLFYNKLDPRIKMVSPVSGEVVEINRGPRRVIEEVVIESDGKDESENFDSVPPAKISTLSREKVIEEMLASGLWPVLRHRPFSKIANPDVTPRDIFIRGMNTAPLAPDYAVLMEGKEEIFQCGINALAKLTDGKIYLSFEGNGKIIPAAFEQAEGVIKHGFSGPHPAGNVSVHIHHIAPINVGDTVWFISAPDVALIGALFLEGKYSVEKIVAVSGSSVKENVRKYYRSWAGASVQSLVTEGDLVDDNVRFINGDVLSGRKISENGYVGFYARQITVIPDTNKRDLFGWMTPGLKDETFSRLFLSKLLPRSRFVKDTRLHGGFRAFIQTGEYERVLPMDIYPQHLVKSIMAEEIEDMIGLGLLEVDVEDFALCSYICPSKIDFGKYIHQGLEMLEREG